MTALARRLALAYVVLLVALALLGAHAQQRLLHQAQLLRDKDVVIVEVASARAAATSVNGPLAVSRWARDRGMVSAPEALDVIAVAPTPLPPRDRPTLTPALEVRTVWR